MDDAKDRRHHITNQNTKTINGKSRETGVQIASFDHDVITPETIETKFKEIGDRYLSSWVSPKKSPFGHPKAATIDWNREKTMVKLT